MSDRRLRIATSVLALIGAGIAGYLVYVHYEGLQPFCVGGGGGCEKVQTSKYAELLGVPVAVLGLAAYLTVLAAAAALPAELARQVTAFVALVGAGFSLYLTYVELAVIDAICQWCVASAVVMCLLAVAALAWLLSPSPAAAASRG